MHERIRFHFNHPGSPLILPIFLTIIFANLLSAHSSQNYWFRKADPTSTGVYSPHIRGGGGWTFPFIGITNPFKLLNINRKNPGSGKENTDRRKKTVSKEDLLLLEAVTSSITDVTCAKRVQDLIKGGANVRYGGCPGTHHTPPC
jgi:hypothetical protein